MKKILFSLALVAAVSITNVNAQGQGAASGVPVSVVSAKTPAPAISFSADKYEFGAVPQGTPVTHVFSFKNTGAVPLVLSSVTASCGCTTPEWPKEPVVPGATANIKVTYNAASIGEFTKPVTVVSNAATPTITLTIHGEVKPAATANQEAPAKTTPVQSAAPKKS